ncbi:capsular polysaccharide export protein, LipB/KpsS family [Rodentibacter trehalosifermentans]|uniref:capsular polysaccharide export protein, LipB/KpsS family n=1 Tax=Rodentibacter trehalosifermentans TaxID=1908263 RepID=UPI000985E49D|nr:capsule biosynthesis protein [Rodentibacter trehalosifermentans]OOF51656.1 capsule biosynthesis protein [Rodentibacter trehalosifermentans]
MNISILVADSLHINQRNFGSFFKFTERVKPTKLHFEDSHKDWIALYGVYDSKLAALYSKIEILSKCSKDELLAFKVNDIPLFSVCRAEVLTLAATHKIWYDNPYPTNTKDIFEKLHTHNHTTLLQNMAAAWYWIEFWKTRLAELGNFTHCCVFSGGLIYQKALIEQLKYTSVRVMVMESLFTGNEYYCEERYSPIANNCDIKNPAVYKSYIKALETDDAYDKERMKAINKMLMMKNKNVEQPSSSDSLIFSDPDRPLVSIIGQVVNDFSVLEYKNNGISTIAFYKELIEKLASAGFNVAIKTHPWEEKKNNLKHPLTKTVLTEFVATLPLELQQRIQVIDHYAIKKLFEQSKWIVGLNSQGLIEAAFEGFKPVQFGNAFYGKRSFTHDYALNDIDGFIQDLLTDKLNHILTLSEWDKFEQFITILLQKHAVSVHNSGILNLQKIFELPTYIPLVDIKPVAKKPNAPSNPSESEVVSRPVSKVPAALMVQNENMIRDGNSRSSAKWRKFKNTPHLFFADAKNPVLRPLKHFFKRSRS